MSRYIDADALREKWLCLQGHDFSPSSFVYSIDNAPTVDAVPVVRCAECRWRPEYGMDPRGNISHAPEYLKFPRDENMEEVCPCSIDDWYYSWMPADDFFCKKGERKEQTDE